MVNPQNVPSINISMKNQLTLNFQGLHHKQGSQTERDTAESKKQYDEIMKQIKFNSKQTPSQQKFQTNLTKANYLPGHYHSHSHEQKNAIKNAPKKLNTSLPKDNNQTQKNYDSNQKTDYSLTMIGQLSKSQEQIKQYLIIVYQYFNSSNKLKPNSLEQNGLNRSTQTTQNQLQSSISKLKIPSEPSESIFTQKQNNIMTVINKIGQQKQSYQNQTKSPYSERIEDNFKKILAQYKNISQLDNQKQFQSKISEQKLSFNDSDQLISGFRTERVAKKTITILLIHNESNIQEYQFDCFTTTNRLIEFLNKQLNYPVIGYSTYDKKVNIDYYLSLKHKDLNPFINMTLKLQPMIPIHDTSPISLKSFSFLQCIGMGGFSRVFLVRSKQTGHFLALKLISKKFIEENQKQSIVQNERDVMYEITTCKDEQKKKFLCQLECAFETKSWVAFGVEYCPGGELFNQLRKVKKMTEEQARPYFIEVLFAVGFLHENNILYRDIKPENILLDANGHAKLADFGLARPGMGVEDEAYSFCGSPEYMAPEMLKQEGHTHSVDYYCLGALLYELITGLPPFYSRDTKKIFQSILQDELRFPTGIGSSEARDLIKKLLCKQSDQRLGTHEGVDEILQHPWIQKQNIEKIYKQQFSPPFQVDLIQSNFDQNELKKGESSFKQDLLKSLTNKDENDFKPMFQKFSFISQNLKSKGAKQERRVNSASDPVNEKNQQKMNLIQYECSGSNNILDSSGIQKRLQEQNSLNKLKQSKPQQQQRNWIQDNQNQGVRNEIQKFKQFQRCLVNKK